MTLTLAHGNFRQQSQSASHKYSAQHLQDQFEAGATCLSFLLSVKTPSPTSLKCPLTYLRNPFCMLSTFFTGIWIRDFSTPREKSRPAGQRSVWYRAQVRLFVRIDCGQTILFHFSVSEMNAFCTSGKNIVAEETLHLNCLPKKQSNLNSSSPHPCLILASNHHPLLTSQKIPPPQKKSTAF